MSLFTLNKTATPAAPAANKVIVFYDTADNRVKCINEFGSVDVFPDIGIRSRNIIGNGSFDWAQRQAPGTLTPYNCATNTARIMTADRWGLTNQTASTQFQQIDTAIAQEANVNSRFYGKFKQITGAGKIMLTQFLPDSSIEHLHGKQIRFQCKMRYSVAASMTVRIGMINLTTAGAVDVIPGAQNSGTFISAFGANGTDPTLGANLVYETPVITESTGTISGNGITCVLGSTWARYSGVFTVPTNALNVGVAIWTNAQLAVNDELNICEVGFYDGYEIRDWFTLSIPLEFERIRRYYQKTFALATAPAQSAGLTGAFRFIAGKAAATAQYATYLFTAPMRAAPTVTFYNPSAATAQVRDSTVGGDCTATAASNTSEFSTMIGCTGNATTAVGNPLDIHMTFDAEI